MEENKTSPIQEEQAEKQTYSAEEVEKMIAEGRKQATEDANKKAEERYQKKEKEAQRLSRMNEEEKREYQLQQREDAIAAKEKQLSMLENKAAASKILVEKGLSVDLVDFIVSDNADAMNDNIKVLEKAFKASVKAEVEKRLGGKTPKVGQSDEALNKESFKKMSIAERAMLKAQDPSEYERLKNMK